MGRAAAKRCEPHSGAEEKSAEKDLDESGKRGSSDEYQWVAGVDFYVMSSLESGVFLIFLVPLLGRSDSLTSCGRSFPITVDK